MTHQHPYDSHGDIVIRPSAPRAEAPATPAEPRVIHPSTPPVPRSSRLPLVRRWLNAFKRQSTSVAEQYETAAHDLGHQARQAHRHSQTALQRLWAFLRQPVWVPVAKRRVREYSRGSLFVLDIFRFGGTFAFIFLALFASLNYQGLTQIVDSYVQSLIRTPSLDTALSRVGPEPALAATTDARANDILSVLPTVGPPDDRIIIPKLRLNVPITRPSTAALLRQDWEQVEQDIQTALRDGVVHYPGTARPGQAGNFFVTGHSSYYPWDTGKYKTVFVRLHELHPGDEYWVYWNGDKHRYIITEKYEVSPSEVKVLDQPSNKREATLMTCTPIGTTLRRLIVKAEEVDPKTGQRLAVGERTDEPAVPQVKLEALPI